MKRIAILSAILSLSSGACFAQAPETKEDLAEQTKLLKAQQDFYDQQTATAKAQRAAQDAAVAAETASITAATALKNAQLTSEFALANALKGAGIGAATGKEGATTFAKSESMLLAMQSGSLALVDGLTKTVCDDLTTRYPGGKRIFIAPADYDRIVQKSVIDVVQLHALRNAAKGGIEAYGKVEMQVAALAGVASALATAQYLAGGIQSIAKLFRTDYTVSYAAATRQTVFEQVLGARCKNNIESNVEGRLRQNASQILATWLRDMAQFVQLNDIYAEALAQEKARLVAERAAVLANTGLKDDEKKRKADEFTTALNAQLEQEKALSRYKNVAAAIKAYLAALPANTTIYDSMVWGQDYLRELGGIDATLPKIELKRLARLSYALNVQDASVKASSTFFSEKWRTFSTAELSYSVTDPDGMLDFAAVYSTTDAGTPVSVKELNFREVSAKFPAPPPKDATAAAKVD